MHCNSELSRYNHNMQRLIALSIHLSRRLAAAALPLFHCALNSSIPFDHMISKLS